MTYKKKRTECGKEHPKRPKVFCWGNHEPNESHWATIMSRSGLQTVTWVD